MANKGKKKKAKGGKVGPREEKKILGKLAEGKSHAIVAEECKRSTATISNVARRNGVKRGIERVKINAGIGAPCKLTNEAIETLHEAIRRGMPVEGACSLVGITGVTFYNWRRRGKAGESGYVEFFRSIEKAQNEGINAKLDALDRGTPQWQAKAWILERRFPHYFALNRIQSDDDQETSKEFAERKLNALTEIIAQGLGIAKEAAARKEAPPANDE